MGRLIEWFTGRKRAEDYQRYLKNLQVSCCRYDAMRSRWAGKQLTAFASRQQARYARDCQFWYTRILSLNPSWVEEWEADLYFPDTLRKP